MKKDRSAALPLLFAGLLLAAGTAALLGMLPLVDCPDCGPVTRAYLEQLSRERDPTPSTGPLCGRCKDAHRISFLNRSFGKPGAARLP